MAVQRSAERGPLGCVLVGLAFLAAGGCGEPRVRAQPAIEFSTVPPAAAGGGATRTTISGRARGARPGQQIVLFAKGGVWWVQPLTAEPFTRIAADGSWTSTILWRTTRRCSWPDIARRPRLSPAEAGACAAVASGGRGGAPRTRKVLVQRLRMGGRHQPSIAAGTMTTIRECMDQATAPSSSWRGGTGAGRAPRSS